jgi:2,4-dienoyl-CoA reductase-like NADH-dependent reductase (Old Yellow Enzyme family)
MRAQGGFALTMTCASHVQAQGRGFPGQLGIFSDAHLPGLTRLAAAIKAAGSLAVTQLHHAGMRSPSKLIGGAPLCPSDDAETGARAMTHEEVLQAREDFIEAAARAQHAGFDGAEIHGAHGYLLCQFLSAEINQRDDEYGGSLENRARLLFEVVDGVRERCGPKFVLGVRLSPERFGMRLHEIREVSQRLMHEGRIDFLDLSLWDIFKEPEDEACRGRSLLSWFTDLERGDTRLGAAGKIMSGQDAVACLDAGADFAVIGRAAVLHHDFPLKVEADPGFRAISIPVTEEYLTGEGLGPALIAYMRRWEGFVA